MLLLLLLLPPAPPKRWRFLLCSSRLNNASRPVWLLTRWWPQYFVTGEESRNDINLCWLTKWQIWMMYRAQCCLMILHGSNQAAGFYFPCFVFAQSARGMLKIPTVFWCEYKYCTCFGCWMFWNLHCAWLGFLWWFIFYFIFQKTLKLMDRVPPSRSEACSFSWSLQSLRAAQWRSNKVNAAI